MFLPTPHKLFTLACLIISAGIHLQTKRKQAQLDRVKSQINCLKITNQKLKFSAPPKISFSKKYPIIHNYTSKYHAELEFKNRIKRHREVCQKYPPKYTLIDQYKKYFKTGEFVNWKKEPMTLIDEKHKLLMCTLPKAGSTNWRVTFGLMLEAAENSTFQMKKKHEKWGSRKDQVGYRIRRDSEGSSAHLLHYLHNSNKSSNKIINGIPKFPYKDFYLNQDLHEKFSLHKNKSLNNYGHFPISAIPPSLQKPTLRRAGHVKLANGYSYRERIGVYTNETYLKSVMVRHPLERLLSAYRDKAQPSYFRARPKRIFPKLTLRNLMRDDNEIQEKLQEMDHFAFKSFLIDNLFRTDLSWDYAGVLQRHWSKSNYLCRLCSIKWDFIAKMETIDTDSEKIFDFIGLTGKVHLGMHAANNGMGKVVNYFKGLPKSIFLGIYEIYKMDFEILGYGVSEGLWGSLVDE